MYYLNPKLLSNEVQNNGLPLFREELGEAFTIIPSRYKSSAVEYSQHLGFQVSFLMSKTFKKNIDKHKITCVKVVYDTHRDPLKIFDLLGDSSLFRLYAKSSFNASSLEYNSKGLLVSNKRTFSQYIILMRPDLLKPRSVISNGLKKLHFASLDDIILQS
mgnify:CR=1 FL=1